MNWKFWQKDKADAGGQSTPKEVKPKELPQSIGQSMVVELGYDPDWVWTLKIVTREQADQKGRFDFRIFDPLATAASSLKVTGYASLEGQSALVLFDGWYEKESRKKQINAHAPASCKGNAA